MNTIQKLHELSALCDVVVEMARGDQIGKWAVGSGELARAAHMIPPRGWPDKRNPAKLIARYGKFRRLKPDEQAYWKGNMIDNFSGQFRDISQARTKGNK